MIPAWFTKQADSILNTHTHTFKRISFVNMKWKKLQILSQSDKLFQTSFSMAIYSSIYYHWTASIYSMFVWIKQQILIARNKYEIINFSQKSNIHRRGKKVQRKQARLKYEKFEQLKREKKIHKNLKLIERSKIL